MDPTNSRKTNGDFATHGLLLHLFHLRKCMVQFFCDRQRKSNQKEPLSLKQKIQMKDENICALIELYGLKEIWRNDCCKNTFSHFFFGTSY